MISTALIREQPVLPHTKLEPDCNRWPDKVTVDISLLLKPKDEEESSFHSSKGTPTHSPASVTRSTPAVNVSSTTSSGSNINTTISSIPAKRSSRPFDHPLSESPAKKQSKWSPEEDTKIIQLRGEGMKWEDISKHLPGRSAISCRLHYQNYLERRSEWDEDRKNKLARLYERFKGDMWARIAEEMAIPWRAAEAMHWQMGEHEMARRAGVTPFSLTTNSNSGMNSPHSSNGFPGSRTHHMRSNSATPRIRRESAPQMVQLPPQVPPQLPSLAELTAGLPAYSPHGHANHLGASRSYHGALTPPHLYHHPHTNSIDNVYPSKLGNELGSRLFHGRPPGSQA